MTNEHDTGSQLNAYQLARLADCASPDSNESPGAKFLESIQDDVNEAVEYGITEPSDTAHEIADGAVPVYTSDIWETFTDLAAWQEDPTELGFEGSDMEKGAMICLYMIAERLAMALVDAAEQDADADETNDAPSADGNA